MEPGKDLAWLYEKKYGKRGYFNYKVLDLNKPCNTITRSGYEQLFMPNGRIVEWWEAALLQSFPKNFKWTGKPRQRWERIGNSVPPQLMKHIALHIKNQILNKTK